MPAPAQDKIQNLFSYPSKKIKTPDTQADTTKTGKLNNDNSLQGWWTRTTGYNTGGSCTTSHKRCNKDFRSGMI